MMPDLGKYAVSVLSAYGVTFLLLAGTVALTLLRGARVKRRLEEAEERRRGRG
ncbi:hemagglutination activity protein [Haematobacter massiliensis]|uniref:Heme exporter protein D n=1 Tax=Haematobacter massiliensis TaxID=195105 RepID=A0A086YCX4_9RHOB|nr:heme exporter protein CcmD [Haematobacter massiliensis]KFI32124.1 hemagglutination activity protein [Haematobacter massiliensis]